MEENFGATKFGEIVTDQKFAKFLHIYSKVSLECSNINFTVF